jgi:hypothetical protein
MANYLLPDARGIDVPIQRLQTYLYEQLYNRWGETGLTSALFDSFGRIYRNETKDGFVPQYYLSGIDYSGDMFYNDRKAVIMWFGLNDPTRVTNTQETYNISLYCFCTIPQLYPNDTAQRVDERVIADVQSLITNKFGFYVTAVVRDVDNVLNKYSGAKKKAALKDNMQQKLCFRIDMTNTIDVMQYNCYQPLATPPNFYAMTGTVQARIKTAPDTQLTQTLVNGVKIQLEYAAGSTLTIPHLVGRYVQPDVILDGNNYSTIQGSLNYMPYDMTTGTFTWDFLDGSTFTLLCNENS